MLPLHTQKSLDQLTWNEVQKIHASLGLKATAATRTRRDYQRRIIAAQPQPIADAEITASLTCATCPFARHIDTNRYCCQVSETATDVTRGHWEAKASCHEAIAKLETETTEVKAPIAQPEEIPAAPAPIFQTELTTALTDDAPQNRGDNGRGRVTALIALQAATIVLPHATKPKADDNFMTAFTKESEGNRKFNDLAYLSQLEKEAQLAIERTEIGSEQEAIAYAHLRQIERDIEFYNRPEPQPQSSPVIQQLENQMKELKADVLSLFKITAFDPSILPTCDDEPEQPAIKSEPEPEGTIHWHSPISGTIVGKKGALRNFYLRKRNAFGHLEIMVVISADFTASEHRSPNIHHQRIRAALEAGRTFDPKAFKNSPQFLTDAEDYRGIGRIKKGADGRWWAWADGGITGQPFPCENLATQYLERIAASKHAQKQTPCIK